MPATVSHTTGLLFLRYAASRGLPAAGVAGWLGVTPRDLERPGHLPFDRVAQAWARLGSELEDPAVGVRAPQNWTLSGFGLLGLCASSAPSVGEALASASRLGSLISRAGTWGFQLDRSSAQMFWERAAPDAPGRDTCDDVMISSAVRSFRELSGQSPALVEFSHRSPRSRGLCEAYEALLGCEVRFGRPANRVVLEREHLDIAPAGNDPAIWNLLTDLAEREAARLAVPPSTLRARGAVASFIGQTGRRPSIALVARRLGMSERTLRRSLEREETSFRRIVSEVCLERAAKLLSAPGSSCTRAALGSGFADAASFGRAWKRFHGASPSRRRGG